MHLFNLIQYKQKRNAIDRQHLRKNNLTLHLYHSPKYKISSMSWSRIKVAGRQTSQTNFFEFKYDKHSKLCYNYHSPYFKNKHSVFNITQLIILNDCSLSLSLSPQKTHTHILSLCITTILHLVSLKFWCFWSALFTFHFISRYMYILT